MPTTGKALVFEEDFIAETQAIRQEVTTKTQELQKELSNQVTEHESKMASGTVAGHVIVEDTLDSESTTNAVSAAQAKILKDMIDAHLADIVTVPEADKILKLGDDSKFPVSSLPLATNELAGIVSDTDQSFKGIKRGNFNNCRGVISNGGGIALFQTSNSMIVLYAVDKTNTNNFLFAIGYKGGQGVQHQLKVINSNTLTLGASNGVGTQVINGGTASNIITYGLSFS